MRFDDTVRFSRRMKSKQKSRVLPRFRDVPSTEYARPLLFHLIPPSSLSFAHNSQDTSRHSFHECNKRYREKGRRRQKAAAATAAAAAFPSEHPGRTLRSSGDAQLLLVRGPGQSRATLNYLLGVIFRREEKLRRDSPRGNFVRQIEN